MQANKNVKHFSLDMYKNCITHEYEQNNTSIRTQAYAIFIRGVVVCAYVIQQGFPLSTPPK